MKNKIFTREFLEELQEQCGAITMVNHYMEDFNMSFHDAILRFANHHSIEPKYCDENYNDSKQFISNYNFITMLGKND